MAKNLLLFVSFFVVSQTHGQSSSEKIPLSPSMVVNESGHGDATLLVDEQALSGDPLDGSSGSPQTYWFPGWQADIYPTSAYIDLGQEYALSDIFLYDHAGIKDFMVEVGEPGNWMHLFTDPMSSYNSWKRHEVNVITRYVRVSKSSAGGNMNEIVLYGSPANNAPEIEQITQQAVTVGGQLSIGLSASDSDGDPLAFSLDSGPGFIVLTDLGNGTATIEVMPQAGDEGVYNIEVSVSDGRGGIVSTAFVLIVQPSAVLMPTPPVDMVRNRPVDGMP